MTERRQNNGREEVEQGQFATTETKQNNKRDYKSE